MKYINYKNGFWGLFFLCLFTCGVFYRKVASAEESLRLKEELVQVQDNMILELKKMVNTCHTYQYGKPTFDLSGEKLYPPRP